jgi:LmbE family N-acetylglucosaminyl deacetylase
MKEWIFLSSHFDDVVLSVGGMVWELTKRGDAVEIWTICAGSPPQDKPLSDFAKMLHVFWKLEGVDAPQARSLEDAACSRVLGASYRRFTMLDCIYRTFPCTDEAVVKVEEDISSPLEPGESHLIPLVTDFLQKNMPFLQKSMPFLQKSMPFLQKSMPEECELVIPLAIGHHRDHVLTRKAAERLGKSPWHYVDYPYVIQEQHDLADWIPSEAEQFSLKVSPDGMKAWQDGIACHQSQLVFFWSDLAEMRVAIEAYSASGGGGTLYKF